MEREDTAGTRFGIPFVTEEGLDTGGFIQERERALGLEKVWEVCGIVAGLFRHTGEQRAFLFGLDHANGLTIDQQQIITRAGFQGHFPQGDSAGRCKIQVFEILNDPAGLDQEAINGLACLLLRRHRKCSQCMTGGILARAENNSKLEITNAQLVGMVERLVLVCSTVRGVQADPSASKLPGERKRFQGKTEGGNLLSFPLVAP